MTPSCPAECGRTVPVGKLLCRPCWGRVPKHLQDDVYRTYRAYVSAKVGTPAFRKASPEYRAARSAAIGSVR